MTGILKFFIETAIGRALGILIILIVALWAFGSYWNHRGQVTGGQKVAAKVEKATDKESQRRVKEMTKVQSSTAKRVDVIDQRAKKNLNKLQEIERATADLDNSDFLPADVVRRLDAVGR